MPASIPESMMRGAREKPGMYFGSGGNRAIPKMIHYVVESLLYRNADRGRGTLRVEIRREQLQQIVHMTFTGLKAPWPLSRSEELWQETITRFPYLNIVAAASTHWRLVTSTDKQAAHLTLTEGRQTEFTTSDTNGKPFVQIEFAPALNFFPAMEDDKCGCIAGMLRDVSALCPGWATELCVTTWPGENRHCYPNGLRDLLFAEDYARWSLHTGCLEFAGEQGDLRVTGCLRFLHAGTPWLRSYVNYLPSQGGAHYEGLGDALEELFGDERRGCREAPFVTNPDSGAKVLLPHTFICAMHVQMNDPHYYGPTRDVLMGDEVRRFVHEVAAPALKSQWMQLQRTRSNHGFI